MNRHEPGQDDLRRVLHDTVDGLEPRPGLDAIRARTREQHSGHGRTWLLGAFGAAVATAAVVAGVAVLGGDPRPTADPDPGGVARAVRSRPPGDASETPSDVPSDGASDGSSGDTVAAPVYFAGDSPAGRLPLTASSSASTPATGCARRRTRRCAATPRTPTTAPCGPAGQRSTRCPSTGSARTACSG